MCRYVYGQRAIWTRPLMDAVELHPGRPPNTIEVLDFSLAAVLSAKDVFPVSSLSEKGKHGTLVAPSTIHVGQLPIFKHDVETHLPYVSTEWNLKKEYALYMIYADGIIGVDVRSRFFLPLLRMLV
jgi:hypothetical protein